MATPTPTPAPTPPTEKGQRWGGGEPLNLLALRPVRAGGGAQEPLYSHWQAGCSPRLPLIPEATSEGSGPHCCERRPW